MSLYILPYNISMHAEHFDLYGIYWGFLAEGGLNIFSHTSVIKEEKANQPKGDLKSIKPNMLNNFASSEEAMIEG